MKAMVLSLVPLLVVAGFAQQWTHVGTPPGTGITDLEWNATTSTLWATTASQSTPPYTGGIFRSTDGGVTWTRRYNPALVARTIAFAPDGWHYASVWLDPALSEGIFQSPSPGDFWVGPIFQVGANDNVFCIQPHPTDAQVVFAGTRNGVVRTTDHGSSWTYVNNGIPNNTWIRALAIDSSGIVAAGTTNGLYISTNSGGHGLAQRD